MYHPSGGSCRRWCRPAVQQCSCRVRTRGTRPGPGRPGPDTTLQSRHPRRTGTPRDAHTTHKYRRLSDSPRAPIIAQDTLTRGHPAARSNAAIETAAKGKPHSFELISRAPTGGATTRSASLHRVSRTRTPHSCNKLALSRPRPRLGLGSPAERSRVTRESDTPSRPRLDQVCLRSGGTPDRSPLDATPS